MTTVAPHSTCRLLALATSAEDRLQLDRELPALACQIDWVGDESMALTVLQSTRYDLVLLGCTSPRIDLPQFLEQIPVERNQPRFVALGGVNDVDCMQAYLEDGANDLILRFSNPALLRIQLDKCLERARSEAREESCVLQLNRERKRVDDLLNIVIPIGVELAAEQDFNRLLEKILLETKSFCSADAGTLYLRTNDDSLAFVIVRNESLDIAMGGTTGQEITFPQLPMYELDTGDPNHHNVATHVALTGRSINIADAYQAEGFDFSGTRRFDARTGYRSKSFWTIPLKNSQGYVIGVLQLINALDPSTGEVIPFDSGLQQMVESMAALAAVALEAYIREQGLRQEIQKLRFQLDEGQKMRQVDELTDSDFFRRLQITARERRKGAHQGSDPVGR